MPDAHSHAESLDDVQRPVSVSHFVHTLRAYGPVIFLTLAGIGLAYAVIAIVLYLTAPSQRVTSQLFRLEFQGASEGRYPDGLRFSSNEIVATPVLLRVFRDNELARFTSFEDFSKSIFVLESNLDYERLAADYQARLGDPKLSPIDRERLQREWEGKAQALSKSNFTINYLRKTTNQSVPETLVRKVLVDVLNGWAAFAVKERHVLQYQIAVLTPDIVSQSADTTDPVLAIQVLRTRVYRVLDNLDDLKGAPTADLIRSTKDRLSLDEIRLRLEEIIRFRLEPLVATSAPTDRVASRAFLQTQLDFDQRRLTALQARVENARQAIILYATNQANASEPSATSTGAANAKEKASSPQETIMPQLSDTFIDRLVTLTKQSGDFEYRKKLIDNFQQAQAAVIPAESAVAYDRQILAEFQSSRSASTGSTQPMARFVEIQTDVRHLVGEMNEVYQLISRNLNPSTELYSLTAPPTSRSERTLSLSRLAIIGLLTLFIALPLIVVGCLIHNRVREEEAEETLHFPEKAHTT